MKGEETAGRVIQHGGTQFFCEVSGQGSPIVLLHGFPLDHAMWQSQIESLSPRFRVVAPDLRGFGRSTLTEADVADGIAMPQYAADVRAMLDHLEIDEPVVLGGFSMGGYVLWQFVLRYPERVRAIVLCDTRAAADSDTARANRLQMAERVLSTGSAAVADGMIPKLLSAATLEDRPEIVRQVQAMISRCSPQAIAAAQRGMACRPDVRARLPSIDKPALVLGGAEDVISPPEEMRQIVAALPQAQWVEIPGAAHMTPVEQPAAVSEALDAFVAGLQ